MFRQACQQYESLLCVVGLESHGTSLLSGSGCWISKQHAVTAWHVIDEAGAVPLVNRHDGVWRCDVVRSWNKWDFAVLRVRERRSESDQEAPNAFPQIGGNEIGLGTNIGYMTWLRKNDQLGNKRSYKYFSTASISFLADDPDGNPRFVLTPSFIEPGFSGSPAFTSDGKLAGLMTGFFKINAEFENASWPHIMPYMTIIPNFGDQLKDEVLAAR